MRRVNTIYIAYIYCLSDNFANRHAIVAGEMRPVFLFFSGSRASRCVRFFSIINDGENDKK
jgi:hypothetical protein